MTSDRAAGTKTAQEESFEAEKRVVAVNQIRALRAAGQTVNPKDFAFTSADDLELKAIDQSATARMSRSANVIDAFLAPGMLRMQIALSIEEQPKTAPALDAD